jgi:hypothetical protein
LLTAENTGGNVGLAITQAIGLTGMLQWGMRQSTELENQMTSVERVLEFTHVEQEPPLTSPQGKIKIIVLSVFHICYFSFHFHSYWVGLAQDRGMWRSHVDAVMSLWVL